MGTPFSMLVIDIMSNPRAYCSRASPKLQCSGPYWTKNSSTQVERRLCLTRLGSLRANICWIVALSPLASLPRRGSMVVGRILLAHAYPRGVHVFPLVGKFKSMRVRCVRLTAARAAARFERDLSMESRLDALSTARGDGLSGREPQSWPVKVLHRGAIEYSCTCGSVSFRQIDSNCVWSLEDRSIMRLSRARVSAFGSGDFMDGSTHCSSLSSMKYWRPFGPRHIIWDQL